MKKVAKGRRWEIRLEIKNNLKIATKKSVSEWKKWTLLKEVKILKYLQKYNISFVPKVLDNGDGWFSYEWIEGEHFNKIRDLRSVSRDQLAQKLLDRAYDLDKIWVIHGELLRPRTNVLVDNEGEVKILDFERGEMGNYSGKNMKHVAQRLAREWILDITLVKSLGWMWMKDIHSFLVSYLQTQMQDTPAIDNFWVSRDEHLITGLSMLHILFLPALLIAVDQLTKLWYYDQGALASSDWITPSFNTGIAWSLPIPIVVIVWFSLLLFLLLVWYYISQLKLLDTNKWIWSLLKLEYGTILILSGGIGNLIDRIWLWWVRDFIDVSPLIAFYSRPIFNIADICVVCGAILLMRYELKK